MALPSASSHPAPGISTQSTDSSLHLSPLANLLSSALPPSSPNFDIHHVSHPPTRCDPLYSPPLGQKPSRTTLTSHFLALSSPASRILVYAIEVHIYTTRTRTTIFVSKADSTGFFPKSSVSRPAKAPRSSISPIRAVTTAFLQFLIDTTRRPHVTTHVTLFARAQDQYLFPNSVNNKGKHVLSDIQLIRWWAKVLDPILSAPAAENDNATSQSPPNGYILVPGLDSVDLRSVFPSRQWIHGHPYDNPALPVRECIPHFEDDPKSRFMDDLEDQGWRSVKTMKDFWTLMEFRQECSLGKSVGFLSVLFEAEKQKRKGHPRRESGEKRSEDSSTSQQSSLDLRKLRSPLPDVAAAPKKKLTLPPDIESASSFTTAWLLRDPETRSLIAKRADRLRRWPSNFASAAAEVDTDRKLGNILSKRDYDKLMASLLDSDFEGPKCAQESSELWIKLAGTEQLPRNRSDKAMTTATAEENQAVNSAIQKEFSDAGPAAVAAGPNVLQPRKKLQVSPDVPVTILQPRKKTKHPESEAATSEAKAEAEPAVNVLQPRKKPKLADEDTKKASGGNGSPTLDDRVSKPVNNSELAVVPEGPCGVTMQGRD
ncbi:Histone acetyltransferase [Drechslerella dactyloides]|uniref:histone acetyltransferase n=1 Tax=Drechslerella dactyloides TaxID=74499 RepID=A0AAD6J075_DREDA|nr:Histone acetyltransferase [Drechslerella dactyloides]